ncbi:MAG: hypothetical protein BM564_01370 [Bacteroidetes bacterium MedPE-SWsnd-G2]|nr:MAG: hypothetical protein BM564_01370 [Bacteroidetes bacterium MedPE-SWsnd-G2]
MKKKETFWLIGTILFVIVFFFGPSGFRNFDLTGETDINLHDTYYVIPAIHFFILITTLIFFSVYLIRMLRRNFKNLTANLIFMISGLLSIWILTGIISIVNSYIGVTETTEYNLPVTNNMFDNVSTILYLTQIIIVILIAYSGFRTGLNYSKIE